MEYSEVKSTELPISLLLEADPSEDIIRSYLPESLCFSATDHSHVIAACVVRMTGDDIAEIYNISVSPKHQKKGVGSRFLEFVLKDEFAEENLPEEVVGQLRRLEEIY